MTVSEMAHTGVATAKAQRKAQFRKWGKRGGRPARLGRKAVSRLTRMLGEGMSQAECATVLGVSVRTIGRARGPNKVGREPPDQVDGTTAHPAHPADALTCLRSQLGILQGFWTPSTWLARPFPTTGSP
jgi:hypothetical protein